MLKNLQDGRYADVVKEFNPAMEKAIPEERLRAVWEMLTAQFGSVKSIDERRSGELKGYRAVELILAFEKERSCRGSCSTATARSPGWPTSLRAWRCCRPPSDEAGHRSEALLFPYSPSMLNAKNRLPPLPSTPDLA